jgi:hypothetical protein
MSATSILSRAGRSVLGLSGAVGVLALGAWLGGALHPARAVGGPGVRTSRATEDDSRGYPNKSTQPPLSPNGKRARPDPSADVMSEIPLGDVLAVNGQPMQLSVFTTHDKPAEVVAFYADAYEKRGLLPIADASQGHVSVFTPGDGMQRFINALPQADGDTLVMVGITNPRNAPKLLDGAANAPFPVPKENRGFLGYASEDAGARAQSGQFLSSLSVEAVQAFYRSELTAAGFHLQGGNPNSVAMTVFVKGPVSISVAAQQLAASSGAAVFVNRIESGAGSAENPNATQEGRP